MERSSTALDSEAGLVSRAGHGDVVAFEALVASRLGRAFRTATAILGNEADANDVVQDAFISAWRRLPSLRDSAKFDAWLDTVIVNRCRDTLRRRHRSKEIALDHAAEQTTDDPTDAVADLAAVEAAFEQLNADQRYLLVMHHLHNVPLAELAGQLGIREGTAKWRLHAARAALERVLEGSR